jgi:uncharacterized membrane protein
VAPKDNFRVPLFHVALTFGTMFALGCLGVGALIGVAFNNIEAGAAIGLAVGLVTGLLGSVGLARRMGRDLATPPPPPPGGWRRWDDDEDRDN